MIANIFSFFCFFSSLIFLQASPSFCHFEFSEPKNLEFIQYSYNPFVSEELWKELEPYFLPVDHPLKVRLDRFFKKSRIILSLESMREAGFVNLKKRKPTQIILGKHPKFSDYLFKIYLDTQPALEEWKNWVSRIEGAKAIQACIERHGFKYFKVPRKWIYPLPFEHAPLQSSRYHPKHFILVVENMHILESKDNLQAFKKKVTKKILNELFVILSEVGLIDSVYPDNIPFTKRGQIAFIDTEHHHHAPVPYHKLKHFLSFEMQQYWDDLIEGRSLH